MKVSVGVFRNEKNLSSPKPMANMEPFEIGVIEDNRSWQNGHVVMRTASGNNFEIMDLSDPQTGSCWANHINKAGGPKVRSLAAGTKIVLEVI